MNKLPLLLAFALVLSVSSFAEKGNKIKDGEPRYKNLDEAKKSGECYYACENGEGSLYRGGKKVDMLSCLIVHSHRPFNCSDSEKSKLDLKVKKDIDELNKRFKEDGFGRAKKENRK
jgi:hypothetical protein